MTSITIGSCKMRGAVANGDAIRAARIKRGLTQEQLAGLAELDVKTVRKAEQGKRLDVRSLAVLAISLETDVNQLFLENESQTDVRTAQRNAVERWMAAWDNRDMDTLLSVYHESGVMKLPGSPAIPFGGTFVGKSEIRRGYELAWATAQTVRDKPRAFTFIVGDDSIAFYGLKGVYTPAGDVVYLPCMQLFIFDGKLIVEHSVEYDTVALRRLLQLPPDASSAD